VAFGALGALTMVSELFVVKPFVAWMSMCVQCSPLGSDRLVL
jgi:hypothetical protein